MTNLMSMSPKTRRVLIEALPDIRIFEDVHDVIESYLDQGDKETAEILRTYESEAQWLADHFVELLEKGLEVYNEVPNR